MSFSAVQPSKEKKILHLRSFNNKVYWQRIQSSDTEDTIVNLYIKDIGRIVKTEMVDDFEKIVNDKQQR